MRQRHQRQVNGRVLSILMRDADQTNGGERGREKGAGLYGEHTIESPYVLVKGGQGGLGPLCAVHGAGATEGVAGELPQRAAVEGGVWFCLELLRQLRNIPRLAEEARRLHEQILPRRPWGAPLEDGDG